MVTITRILIGAKKHTFLTKKRIFIFLIETVIRYLQNAVNIDSNLEVKKETGLETINILWYWFLVFLVIFGFGYFWYLVCLVFGFGIWYDMIPESITQTSRFKTFSVCMAKPFRA